MSSLAITPADTIELNLANGESAEASVSVVNSNDQKVLIKLRSNAGKLLRIKHSMFALDSKQKITLDIRIPSKFVDELIQKYTESGSLECYKLQFNVISISDLAFDKISKLPEEQQMECDVEVGYTADISDNLLYSQVCACGNGRRTQIRRVHRHVGVFRCIYDSRIPKTTKAI